MRYRQNQNYNTEKPGAILAKIDMILSLSSVDAPDTPKDQLTIKYQLGMAHRIGLEDNLLAAMATDAIT